MENKVQLTENQKQYVKEFDEAFFEFKKKMKCLSKKNLIGLLWVQSVKLKEMQDLAKHLYEEKQEQEQKEEGDKNE